MKQFQPCRGRRRGLTAALPLHELALSILIGRWGTQMLGFGGFFYMSYGQNMRRSRKQRGAGVGLCTKPCKTIRSTSKLIIPVRRTHNTVNLNEIIWSNSKPITSYNVMFYFVLVEE